MIAQTTWINPGDGLWREASNWSAGAPNDTVGLTTIENTGTKIVTVDAAAPLANLRIQRLTVSGHLGFTNTLLLQNVPLPLEADGTVTVNPGGVIRLENSELQVDGIAGASFVLSGGSLELAGGKLSLLNAARGRVGFGTSGFLRVLDGEVFASEDLLVGALAQGNGYLEILGGRVEVARSLDLADDLNSTGLVTVAGGTLIATNNTTTTRIGDDGVGALVVRSGTVLLDDVSVGRSVGGNGELRIEGGSVATKDISLGRFSGSEGTLIVSGGELSLAEDSLLVGREAAGSAIFSGGQTIVYNVAIATNINSSGELTVSGGVLTVRSNLVVGSVTGVSGIMSLSSGTLTITNETGDGAIVVEKGTVTMSGGLLQVDQLSVTNQGGTFTLSGGTVRTGGTAIENGQKFVVGDGTRAATLHLEGGTHIFPGGLEISPNATLSGCGTIVGTIVNNGGIISTNCGGEAPTLTNPRVSAGVMRFDFASEAGVRYVAEFKNDLAEPAWTLLRTYDGTGGTVTVEDALTGVARFYRVRLE